MLTLFKTVRVSMVLEKKYFLCTDSNTVRQLDKCTQYLQFTQRRREDLVQNYYYYNHLTASFPGQPG